MPLGPAGPKPEHEHSIGVGIQGMRERMRELSGRLEISSRVNEGTAVVATVPIARVRRE
jgi:signal transduction histidine kinase